MKKYTIITGSSSGIGFELAKNISQYSNVILHSSRDYNKMDKLKENGIHKELEYIVEEVYRILG